LLRICPAEVKHNLELSDRLGMNYRWLIALLIFKFSSMVFGSSLHESRCKKDIQTSIKKQIEYIKNNYKNEIIYYSIKDLRFDLKFCGEGLKFFGINGADLAFWENESLKNYLIKIDEDIKFYSKFRSVEDEVYIYEWWVGKYKGSSNDKSNYKIFLEQGIESAKQEEKKCSPTYDLSASMGPVDSQGNIGWCYAYTVADLISQKLGKKVSAMDLAINSDRINIFNGATRIFGQLPEGGILSTTINAANFYGVCADDRAHLSKDKRKKFAGEDLVRIGEERGLLLSGNKKVCDTDIPEMFPTLLESQVLQIAEKSMQIDFLTNLKNQACRKRERKKQFSFTECKSFGASLVHTSKHFECIDKALASGSALYISYNGSVLEDPNIYQSSANHASSIVGRRFNQDTKVCEYLVRNSWGEKCDKYSRNYTCEKGNIWIPRALLMKHTGQAAYLETN